MNVTMPHKKEIMAARPNHIVIRSTTGIVRPEAAPELAVAEPEPELDVALARLIVALLVMADVPAAVPAAPVCSGWPENVCCTVTALAVVLTSGIPLAEISLMLEEPPLKSVCARPIMLF